MPDGFSLALTIFLGLCLGSFATALSWRLPRGIPIAVERSKCPSCRRVLGIVDLVPVFSWVLLRGRCRTCGSAIGWRYPLIELATLVLCVAFYERFGLSLSTGMLFCLAPVVIAMADIDFGFRIIPDSLNVAVLLIGAATLVANAFSATDPPAFIMTHAPEAVEGMIVYGLGSWALRQGVMAALKKDPMGWGDIKFFAAAGFWQGMNPEKMAHFMLISGLSGIIIALFWKKIRKEPEFPFGPALLAAFGLLLFLEPPTFIFQ